MFEDAFTYFDTIHERDRHRTDGQTPHDGVGRGCICRHRTANITTSEIAYDVWTYGEWQLLLKYENTGN